jgi:S-adenosylmethionine synthetase
MFNYWTIKEAVRQSISKKFKIPVIINNADDKNTQFVTTIGTSLEAGDSGATGRGNRRNGLITPTKPMTMEAYYGKNDSTHIGRMYQDDAIKLANKYNKRVLLVNKIGGDIKQPIIYKW